MTPQLIAHTSSSFLMHLVDPAVRSLALGTFAALLLYVSRVKNPSVRLAVWTAILYAALAMPLLALMLPPLSLPLPSALAPIFTKTASASARIAAPPVETATLVAASSSITNDATDADAPVKLTAESSRVATAHTGMHFSAARRVRESEIAAMPQAVASVEEFPAADTIGLAKVRLQSAPRLFPWAALAAGLFSLVSFLMVSRIALGSIFARRLARSSATVADRDALRVLLRQARAAGVKSPPRLAESEVVSVPVALGILRPVILLPLYWREWDEATLAAVIAHEMSHIGRRDALTQRLALVHRAIFWFSPLAWWLNRALADAAEEASDEAALLAGADRAFYAETLLGFFTALSENSGRVYWQGVSMAAPGQADRRVDRILAWKGSISMRIRKSLAVSLALFGIPVVLLAAAARPSAQAGIPALPAAPAAPALPAPAPLPTAAPVAPSMAVSAAPVLAQSPQPAPVPPALPDAQAPAAPQAPAAAPVSPAPPNVFYVEPRIVTPDDRITLQVDPEIYNDIDTKVMKSFDKAQKQMTITMNGFQGLSAEDQQKLNELEAKLAALRVQLVENHPEVKDLEKQISALTGQIDMQLKQVMPMKGFQFQMGPMTRLNLGDEGERFVIVSGDSPIVSGNTEDVEHATGLRSKINGDFIWFQHDEKSYIIRDQALVNQAKAIFKPEEDLGEKQRALGKQQQALGDQQRALGDKMRDVHVTIPDLTPDMQKLEAQMKQLSTSGGTQQQIGDLQRQMGELMRRMGDSQSQAGEQQRQIGEQMRQLGDQQRTLGDQQRDLGHQQRDAVQQALPQMKQLLDDAVAKGTAQPE
jgi:bla regulator protein blaR1